MQYPARSFPGDGASLSKNGPSDGKDINRELAAEFLPIFSDAPGSASARTFLSFAQLRKKIRDTPGISEKKKVEGKWVPKDSDDLIADLEAFAPGSASAPQLLDPMTISESNSERKQANITQLREKVRQAPGIKEKKKVGGKWVPKDRDDLIADLEAFAPGSASAPQLLDPMTMSENNSKRKQTNITQLRKKVRQAPGISEKKNVEGEWIPKDSDELLADLAGFAQSSGSASMPTNPISKSERDAKRRQTEVHKAREVTRKQSDEYKAKEKALRQTEDYKSKERERYTARSQTEEYKSKERERHAAPAYKARAATSVKMWRAQRKQLKFWEQSFVRWHESVGDILHGMVRECVFSVPEDSTEQTRRNVWQCALGEMTTISVQPYAPCFSSDGSVSIVQHGISYTLPRLVRPRGLQPLAESVNEYRLALSLRCRIGPCLDEPGSCNTSRGDPWFTEYHWFANKFGYRCPMHGVSKGAVPKPIASIRRFLCNNQCPLMCCTSRCPWHRNSENWNRVGSLKCCPCGDDSCTACVPQDAARDVSLQSPPPPGYKLYTGVGEPVSDSTSTQKNVFQLVCEHYKCVPVRTGASFDEFYNRFERTSGFRPYPRNWDMEHYEQVDCVVDSVRLIGSDQFWTREQRDAWLREPSYHEWKWRPYPSKSVTSRVLAANESVYARTKSALEYLLSDTCWNQVQKKTEHRGFVSDVFEGPTSITCTFCKYVAGRTAFPPEDIALRAAEAIAIFQATLEDINPILGPWDVLCIAEHWRDVCENLAPSFGRRVCERKQRSLANVEAAVRRVVSTLESLNEEINARVESALSARKQRAAKERACRVFVVNRLSEINVRSIVSQCDEPGPIFAVETDADLSIETDVKASRTTALDCKCHVPWHERSSWERRFFSQYKLPPPASLWQSQTLKLPSGVSETVWVQQGAALDSTQQQQSEASGMRPGNLFSFGAIPGRPHALETNRCEFLSGRQIRAMFHECWKKWRADESEEFPEGSEEEQVEQSENDAGGGAPSS